MEVTVGILRFDSGVILTENSCSETCIMLDPGNTTLCVLIAAL